MEPAASPGQSFAGEGDKGVAGGVNVMHCDPFSPLPAPHPSHPRPGAPLLRLDGLKSTLFNFPRWACR